MDGGSPQVFFSSLNMNGPDLSGAHLASTHHTCLLPDAQTLPTYLQNSPAVATEDLFTHTVANKNKQVYSTYFVPDTLYVIIMN